ncbi:MAG: aminodeoxychorismate synthase component I [Acidimicrobiales bacterium]
MDVLVIDNHDSFTYNLVQLVAAWTGSWPRVVRNDEITDADLRQLRPDAVILSPGPGHPGRPRDFGVSRAAIAHLDVPLLGVCLGHQGLAHHFGASVDHAPTPMHGRTSEICHDESELFAGIPQRFPAVRYHSLAVTGRLPDDLVLTAWTPDGVPMGIRHRRRPLWGVQFHPESIGTPHGPRLVANFLALAGGRPRSYVAPPSPPRAAADTVDVEVRTIEEPPDAESVFVDLFGETEDAFWLDSSLYRPGLSRFSFMGTGPRVAIPPDGPVLDHVQPPPRATPDRPFPFAGGHVGFLGYELKRELGFSASHHSPVTDAAFLRADRLLVFDHELDQLHLVASGEGAEAWLDDIEARLAAVPPPPLPATGVDPGPVDVSFRRSKADYLDDVRRCLREIHDGETYEVCLTNQLTAPTVERPLDLYRILRRRSPAPYAAFLRFGELAVLCSSPERFLRVTAGGEVTAKPIKGTAARGTGPVDDAAGKASLRASVKDRAENLMIVDLLRNDLGRVCVPGTVEVPSLMDVESFATVHQLVSTVSGRLRPGLSAIDCVKAAFPGGSMTGAPKARTVEILDRLEPGPRGVYSGCIGWFGWDGAADLNIVIRTAVVTPEGTSIGVGGAVVALSDPEREFDETLLKAAAIIESLAELNDGLPLTVRK